MRFFLFPFFGLFVFLLVVIPQSIEYHILQSYFCDVLKELECYECSYSETPPIPMDKSSAGEYNEKCLDPLKHKLEPKVCKGDVNCVKGSYIHSLNGKEMYRRCEPAFDIGCKPLPNTNVTQSPLHPQNGSQAQPHPQKEDEVDQPVTYTKEYVCVCAKDRCNSEPGDQVQWQNFSDATEYKRPGSGSVVLYQQLQCLNYSIFLLFIFYSSTYYTSVV